MFKLSLTWHMKFFNDFHWFSMTFPGKIQFFQVNIKFHDFSSQGLNSMTFPGLCEPWFAQTFVQAQIKKTSKFRGTGPCEGNSPVTGAFPPPKASYAENVSIWWRHHIKRNVYKHSIVGVCNLTVIFRDTILVQSYRCWLSHSNSLEDRTRTVLFHSEDRELFVREICGYHTCKLVLHQDDMPITWTPDILP